MNDVTLPRKQRLRTLENNIRTAAEEIQTNGLAIGRWLCEIRDDELWEEEYDSWNEYLDDKSEELVGKSFTQAARLIRAAEISKRIPDLSSDVGTELGPHHLDELGRLAPNVGRGDAAGVGKDYSRLKTQDVARVLKSAVEIAEGEPVSVRDIREAVNKELGIDRTAQTRETKRQRQAEEDKVQARQGEEALIENRLPDLIWHLKQHTDGLNEYIAEIGEIEWKRWRKSNRVLITRVIAACDAFADLLRRTEG